MFNFFIEYTSMEVFEKCLRAQWSIRGFQYQQHHKTVRPIADRLVGLRPRNLLDIFVSSCGMWSPHTCNHMAHCNFEEFTCWMISRSGSSPIPSMSPYSVITHTFLITNLFFSFFLFFFVSQSLIIFFFLTKRAE